MISNRIEFEIQNSKSQTNQQRIESNRRIVERSYKKKLRDAFFFIWPVLDGGCDNAGGGIEFMEKVK